MDEPKDLQTFLNACQSNKDQFENFLRQRNCVQQLQFVWAVQGIEKESYDSSTIEKIVRTINAQLLDKLYISDKVKRSVKDKIASKDYSEDIFDEAFEEVWNFLETVFYTEFLSSNVSAERVPSAPQQTQPPPQQQSSPPPQPSPPPQLQQQQSPQLQQPPPPPHQQPPSQQQPPPPHQQPPPQLQKRQPADSSASQYISSVPRSLEPLFEGQELKNKSSSTVVGLTRETLKATEIFRSGMDIVPVRQKPKFPYHYPNYTSYNPVSRQDSEVQSFSSGCLTDSEAIIETRNKRKSRKEELNCCNLTGLPNVRDAKRNDVSALANSDPPKFAALLTQKLQDLLLARERAQHNEYSQLANEIRDKLKLGTRGMQEETQPEDILDEHVSRVWSDVTPDSLRSPPGRREYKRIKAAVSAALRPRNHKDQEHQMPKSRTFPSTTKYDQDSGISITTTSTFDDRFHSWLNESSARPSTKVNAVKNKKNYIQCLVDVGDATPPFSFKIPAANAFLGKFKDHVPRKGNYRYYFKSTDCDNVVLKELTREDAAIPLYEGKIIAKLQEL